jgi:hypothetical protein
MGAHLSFCSYIRNARDAGIEAQWHDAARLAFLAVMHARQDYFANKDEERKLTAAFETTLSWEIARVGCMEDMQNMFTDAWTAAERAEALALNTSFFDTMVSTRNEIEIARAAAAAAAADIPPQQ